MKLKLYKVNNMGNGKTRPKKAIDETEEEKKERLKKARNQKK